jgi:hypothetical protein
MTELEAFIIKAKAKGWVGEGRHDQRAALSKTGSSEVTFAEGDWHYRETLVGFSDFCGQEIVSYKGEPVWSMVYYGYLLDESRCTAAQAVAVLREALGAMYTQHRFLGGFVYHVGEFDYRDVSTGDFLRFRGTEEILLEGIPAYQLTYCGGNVRK